MTPVKAVDHLAIEVKDLDAACRDYALLLGADPIWRGEVSGAPSALLDGGNVMVALRAAAQPRGLCGICFAVDDAARMQRRMQRLGVPLEASPQADPLRVAGLVTGGGDLLRAPEAAARGVRLAFVERGPDTRAPVTGETLTPGLDHLVIASGDAQATAFVLAARLGLDLRLDMQREEWGGRFLFFRCGDLILEVVQGIGDLASDRDALYGLSWRVSDAGRARAQLAAAGFDVSAVRDGRRPGTRVFTLRDRSAAVPTLMIQPPERPAA
jgi:catechol 2,3-dioxygenase-like lactoylglutathione lyase family enzyme